MKTDLDWDQKLQELKSRWLQLCQNYATCEYLSEWAFWEGKNPISLQILSEASTKQQYERDYTVRRVAVIIIDNQEEGYTAQAKISSLP